MFTPSLKSGAIRAGPSLASAVLLGALTGGPGVIAGPVVGGYITDKLVEGSKTKYTTAGVAVGASLLGLALLGFV